MSISARWCVTVLFLCSKKRGKKKKEIQEWKTKFIFPKIPPLRFCEHLQNRSQKMICSNELKGDRFNANKHNTSMCSYNVPPKMLFIVFRTNNIFVSIERKKKNKKVRKQIVRVYSSTDLSIILSTVFTMISFFIFMVSISKISMIYDHFEIYKNAWGWELLYQGKDWNPF